MTIHPILTRQYAQNIYKYGLRTFASIPVDYHPSVIKYAADNFTLAEIDTALAVGRISEDEYTTTMEIIAASEPEIT